MTFVDPYFDTGLGELRNLLDAKTATEFQKLEPQIVFANELELESAKIPRTNDLAELLAIHKQLFHNIYDWAGKIRTVDIRKNVENSEHFLIVSKIRDATNYVFSELAKENYLRGLDRAKFIKRLAYFYDQLNFIHPFREGNGRTQRIFWSRIASDADYEINWHEISSNENDAASKLATENMDYSLLEKMFTKIIKIQPPPNA